MVFSGLLRVLVACEGWSSVGLAGVKGYLCVRVAAVT